MKSLHIILAIITILVLVGCTFPAPVGTSPTQSVSQPEAATPTRQGESSAGGDVVEEPAQPTATQPPAVTNTAPAPTATEAPPAEAPADAGEQGSGQDAAQPTATKAAPTATTYPVTNFDPDALYGKPSYENPMVYPNLAEWAKPETEALPDDSNIRLQFKDGKLYVTGKQMDFSTWWFSYHDLKNFYLEMTFDTETCSGGDAYGMIIRGPAHLAGVSYGYVIAFTCDGHAWVFRLDGINPWDAEELIDETKNNYILPGSDKLNTVGVRAEGDTFYIVANGYEFARIKDDEFSQGRIGVFVRAADTDDYTYRVTNLRYWKLK
jgi:hypothetical protein